MNSAVKNGQVWIIYPFRKDANGKQGVAELLYELGPKAKESIAIYSDISDDGKFAYFTLTVGNHVAALDISDLNNVKRLDNPDEQQPIIGPHYIKISPDKKNLLVCGYFVQAGDASESLLVLTVAATNARKQISVLNTPGDYKVHWIDILDNGALSFNRTVDFETIFTRTRGGAVSRSEPWHLKYHANKIQQRPHSAVIFDLSDPNRPVYY